jgi:hypothetical protein
MTLLTELTAGKGKRKGEPKRKIKEKKNRQGNRACILSVLRISFIVHSDKSKWNFGIEFNEH